MKTYYACFDPTTGRISKSGSCDLVIAAAQPRVGEAVALTSAPVDDLNYWVNAWVIEQRPAFAPFPTALVLGADEDWQVAGVPDGTDVWIDGTLAGVVDATGLVLSFPRAGTWKVRLEPPFPWKIAECEVTVS